MEVGKKAYETLIYITFEGTLYRLPDHWDGKQSAHLAFL
jgi:hypothetical protein